MAVPPTPPIGRDAEEMPPIIGSLITLAAFLLPSLVLAGIGLAIGNGYTAIAFTILWNTILLATSIKFIRPRTFLVVERFAKVWDVKFSGPRLLIPFIDTQVLPDDFLQKSVELYMVDAEHRIEIDFKDGSAPVKAAAWYQVGNPADIESGRWTEVRKQVLKYAYRVRYEERPARVAEIFQGGFRDSLESKTLAEAQADMENLAIQGTNAASAALAEIGVYPFPGKGIIVRDIDLPDVLIELRERELRGRMDAEEAINRSRSYWEPIEQMKKGLEAKGIIFTNEEVMQLFLAQKGFETLQKTGSNVSLVAADIGGALKTITVGSTKPSGSSSGSAGGGTP